VLTIEAGKQYEFVIAHPQGVTKTRGWVDQILPGEVSLIVNGWLCQPVPLRHVLDAVLVRE
jgi:hypothetical protein